jgi:curli biogenesis system outer membrane secretion channel CsgG
MMPSLTPKSSVATKAVSILLAVSLQPLAFDVVAFAAPAHRPAQSPTVPAARPATTQAKPATVQPAKPVVPAAPVRQPVSLPAAVPSAPVEVPQVAAPPVVEPTPVPTPTPPPAPSFQAIAVVPFECKVDTDDNAQVSERATSVAEQAIYRRFAGIKLVERRRIAELMKELSLSASNFGQSTAELGKILGVNYIVLGDIDGYSHSLADHGKYSLLTARSAVNIKLVDVSTGEIALFARSTGYSARFNANAASEANARVNSLDKAVRSAIDRLPRASKTAQISPGSLRDAPVQTVVNNAADRSEEDKFLSAMRAEKSQQLWGGLIWSGIAAGLFFGLAAAGVPALVDGMRR